MDARPCRQGGELTITPHAMPNAVELEIRDTGVGIPPEAQKRIFSLFYTTKPGGTGVGLAMAFRVVQLHNGTIDFSSEVNHGTTFASPCPPMYSRKHNSQVVNSYSSSRRIPR